MLSLVGEPQEEEFRDGGLVSLMHVSADLKKNTGSSYLTRSPDVGFSYRLEGKEAGRKVYLVSNCVSSAELQKMS